MITKHIFSRLVKILFYGYFLYLVILFYSRQLNNVFSNDYFLLKNVKIDSVYFVQVASGPKGSAPYINFKDSGKTVCLTLDNNTLLHKKLLTQFINKDIKTYNFIKREGSKSFFPEKTRYFIYDDRFICDSDGKCNFTEENKNKRLMYLSLGFLIFIGIHYGVYRFDKNKKGKSLEE